MNSEDKLSSNIVTAVRNKYPHTRGCFFHVSNERNSKQQAYMAKAIGIHAGVSDFIYLSEGPQSVLLPEGYLNFLGLEVKVPNSRHDTNHVEQQVEWGELIENLGGKWRLITSVEEAVSCIEGNLQGYSTSEMRKLLKDNKLKNIIIPKWQQKY